MNIFLTGGTGFITWEEIARQAIAVTASKSRIILIDRGYSKEPKNYLVRKIEKHFKLVFKAREKITEHISYLQKVIRGGRAQT